MKGGVRVKFKFVSIVMFLIVIIAGCSSGLENEEQYIKVNKRIGDENMYEEFKDITENKQVQQVKQILDEIEWENAKVEMVSPHNFEFMFKYKSPKIDAKSVLYKIWISPDKDKLEVVRGDSEYGQLNEENSAVLFEIVTGEKLSDL